MNLSCFKAYDIRGKLGSELNEDIARRIGRAFGEHLRARRVVVGCDVRLSSESLKAAVIEGLLDAGADVIDIGLAGTEEVYFAAFHLDVDGGIEITASHNPADYNGMKLVRGGARPISGDTGLRDIQRLAEENVFPAPGLRGRLSSLSILEPYVDHLLGYIDPASSGRLNWWSTPAMALPVMCWTPSKAGFGNWECRCRWSKSITSRTAPFPMASLTRSCRKTVPPPARP